MKEVRQRVKGVLRCAKKVLWSVKVGAAVCEEGAVEREKGVLQGVRVVTTVRDGSAVACEYACGGV